MLLTAKSCLADRFCSTELSSSVVSMEKAMTAPLRRRTFRRLRNGCRGEMAHRGGHLVVNSLCLSIFSVQYPHSRSPMGTPMPGPVLPRMAALSSWYL